LKNQLYIYGTLFTENTIGASKNIIPVCPYYIDDSVCTQAEAQKYDLNYIRRYFLTTSGNPANG